MASPAVTPSLSTRKIGTVRRLARLLVDDDEHIVQRFAERVGAGPSGEAFGHGIHPGNAPGGVDRDHSVANTAERHVEVMLGSGERSDALAPRLVQRADDEAH